MLETVNDLLFRDAGEGTGRNVLGDVMDNIEMHLESLKEVGEVVLKTL